MKGFFPPLFFNRALDWHSLLPNRASRQSRSRQKRRFKSQNVDPSCRARHRKEETRTSCSPHIVWVCQNGIFRINVNFFFLFLRPTKRRQNAFSKYVMGQFLWQNNLTRGSVPHFKVEITSDCLVQLGGGVTKSPLGIRPILTKCQAKGTVVSLRATPALSLCSKMSRH